MAAHPDVSAPDSLHARLQAIVDRLDTVRRRYERARDSRCVFAYAYAVITRQIDHDLHTIHFQDPAWIVTLAEVFVGRYFAALEAYDRSQLASRAWQTVLDAICSRRSSVLEDLVFAITAHIVHDLPLALGDVGLADGQGRSRLHDFDAVNDIMGHAMDRIRRDVTRRYSPGLRWLDQIERRYDLILTDYGIRMSRALAWYNAERLLAPDCHQDAADAIELSPVVLVQEVTHPPLASARLLLRAARAFAALFRRWPNS